ncbi:MAG: glycosyltransferase [Eubacteriales bacterium]|nr:glycosyltransferase [Eubacteriales bacterium]
MKEEKIKVLMCGSDVANTKGGIVSVINNYLDRSVWEDVDIRYVATHRDGSGIQKLKLYRKGLKEIKKILEAGEADIVHLHMSERGSIYRKTKIAALCNKYGVPVIIHHHGANFFESVYSMKARDRDRLQEVLETVSMNLVLNKDFMRNLRRIAPGANISVLHNGVKVSPVTPVEEKIYITTMGRLGQRKGTYDLINAIEALDGELKEEIQFCLCGDGETEKAEDLIRQKGLQKRIAHVGWVSGEEKQRLLQKTLVHILPSYNEGLPMSILETMGMGIPNIATNINGIPEIIRSGENGILIEPGEQRQLEDAICEMINNPEVYSSYSRKALQTIQEEFTVDIHIKKLAKLYKRIAEENAEPEKGEDILPEKDDFSPEEGEELLKQPKRKNEFSDHPKHRIRNLFIALGLVILILASVICVNEVQNQKFGTTFYRISSSKIKNNARVVLLTDLHNHEYGEENSELVAKIRALEPDMIAMAGDMVLKDDPDTSVAVELCGQLLSIAPVYYSLGNHEGEMIYNQNIPLDTELAEIGVNVLYNDAVEADVNGNQMLIGGVGTAPEQYEEYSESFVSEYEKADEFKLMLAHYPSLFYEYMADTDIDLALAGHFHGGQIQLPKFGGLLAIPLEWFPKYCDGKFTLESGGTLIVSRGLGNSHKIPRINNQPELVVVDIRQY